MNRKLTALLILLIVATGASRSAGPPASVIMTPRVLSATPLLAIHEVDETGPCLTVMLPESMPVKRPGRFYFRVNVQVPFTEAVYVPRTTRVKRTVLRAVPREVNVIRDVFVPVVKQEKQLRTVYREQSREEVVARQVYVPVTVKECRRVYRKVTKEVPVCEDVYVPVVSREKKMRMVYVNDSVRITRTVPVIRMVDTQVSDPATGKMVTVQRPTCDHRQISEMVDRYVLQYRPIEETVTSYRFERRTVLRTVEEYVLDPQPASEDVVTYRLENRLVRENIKHHVPETALVDETTTCYRLEKRPVRETVTDYLPELREVDETTYCLEMRSGLRSVEQIVCCHGEIIVPVTSMRPVLLTRKRLVAEPLTAGCVTASGGGFVAIAGATGHAPVYGGPFRNSTGISPE